MGLEWCIVLYSGACVPISWRLRSWGISRAESGGMLRDRGLFVSGLDRWVGG